MSFSRTSRARKWSFTCAASAAAIALGLAAPAALAASNVPSEIANYATNDTLNAAAMTVAETLTTKAQMLPDFAGLQIVPAGVELDIVGAPTAAIQAAIDESTRAASDALKNVGGARSDGAIPISIRMVSRTLAQLNATTSALDSDQTSWAEKGIILSSWGPDIKSNTVLVHLASYTTVAQDALFAAYGPIVSIAPQDQVPSASYSRTADAPWWYGADSIHNGTTGCTSWFSAHSTARGYLAPTAGHCGSGTWSNGSTVMGSVTARQFGGSMDGELISVTGSDADVWSDPTSAYRSVVGVATSDPIGGHVCTDGTTDREVCNVYIDSINQDVSYDGQTITGTVFAYQLDDKPAFSAGDSGGPVYSAIGSYSCNAYGMILAYWSGDANQGWYMPARTVDSYFSISVLT